jgi:hypothetical protein
VASKTLQEATINRNYAILAGGILGLFLPRRWMVGTSLLLMSIGFAEVMQSLEDPGPPLKTP